MSDNAIPPAMLLPAVTPDVMSLSACARCGPTRASASSALDHASATADGCATLGVVFASATVLVAPVVIFFLSPISFAL